MSEDAIAIAYFQHSLDKKYALANAWADFAKTPLVFWFKEIIEEKEEGGRCSCGGTFELYQEDCYCAAAAAGDLRHGSALFCM